MTKTNVDKSKKKVNNSKGAIGFEDKLWEAADKMRNNMDPAEYKHVVLGLIFLKYISDAFEEKYNKLKNENFADPEDPDEYMAENIFWVPKEARWSLIKDNSKNPKIGIILDDAMDTIEKSNNSLKGVLPKIYGSPDLNKIMLGGIIDLISDIGLGDRESQSKDMLGKVYEYFLGKFAMAEGKGGGQFFTPTCIVRLLVEMIQPYKGRVYDPCCGSGGMFVQSERFVEARGGKLGEISIYGQESNPTTWKLAKMNLAIRGIEANLGPKHADSFHNDLHPSVKADFILANPPFNISDWGGDRLKDDVRWKYGIPYKGNANYSWIQHFIHHLTPNGIAGFVLANGSLTSEISNEGKIRKAIIKADLIDCIISLPSQLFLTTGIPACLWFVTRSKSNNKFRNRQGEILFIDTRSIGHMIDRTTREFTEDDIKMISGIYHEWKKKNNSYEDKLGFCKSISSAEIKDNSYILIPGRYVGYKKEILLEEDFHEQMNESISKFNIILERSKDLEKKIKYSLEILGFKILSDDD
ncbi:MAG TPA: SAM-dependent DNA methyltransferase [bacterium]|nr:SAM-dependent DNA methyltransferase [bacterium]